jgi:hypothetical protein
VAKTADVLQAIWADPWFVALPPDGKLIFLWAITNEHSNLAGLYVVAEETIRHETKFSGPRLKKALELVGPTMIYREESGVVCVPSRPKHVRSKTPQIAKSIAAAVDNCPHPEIQSHYMARYGQNAWLGEPLQDLALDRALSEPQRASGNLAEVPSQSHSQSPKDLGSKETSKTQLAAEFKEWLEHFHATTGRSSMQGTAEAKRSFAARRKTYPLADLKLATVGCHGDEHLRRRGFDRPETILREGNIGRYIELAKGPTKPDRSRYDAGTIVAEV